MDRYASSDDLRGLQRERPELFEKLVSAIHKDLRDFYKYPCTYWGASREDETPEQHRARETMVEFWQMDLDWGWQLDYQKKVLEDLFYTIWNQDFKTAANPAKSSDDRVESPSSSRQEQNICESDEHHCEIRQAGKRSSDQVDARLAKKIRKEEKYATKRAALDEEAERGHTWRGPIKTKALMQDALPAIRDHKSNRYQNMSPDDSSLVETLSSLVNPSVLEVFGKESFSRDDFVAIGGNIDFNRAGVYFHMLFHPDQADFYGYGGQTNDLEQRINQEHCNPWFRARHPSLHYHVWDSRSD